MNLYAYLRQPASRVPLYTMFGLDPLPYRIAYFAILGLNLVLLYHFCARLANSREIAFLATFLASYHPWFVDLYCRSRDRAWSPNRLNGVGRSNSNMPSCLLRAVYDSINGRVQRPARTRSFHAQGTPRATCSPPSRG